MYALSFLIFYVTKYISCHHLRNLRTTVQTLHVIFEDAMRKQKNTDGQWMRGWFQKFETATATTRVVSGAEAENLVQQPPTSPLYVSGRFCGRRWCEDAVLWPARTKAKVELSTLPAPFQGLLVETRSPN